MVIVYGGTVDKPVPPLIRRNVGLICDMFIFKHEDRLSTCTFGIFVPGLLFISHRVARGFAFFVHQLKGSANAARIGVLGVLVCDYHDLGGDAIHARKIIHPVNGQTIQGAGTRLIEEAAIARECREIGLRP